MEQIKKADVIFHNGVVITANETDEIAEAVAVSGKDIVYCGDEAGVWEFRGDDTEVIDLAGRALMPGFIDSHIHFSSLGLKKGPIIDSNFEKIKSVAELLDAVRDAARSKKPGEWIVLSGYDHNKLLEQRHPTLKELDEAAPENPVRCVRCCAHMGVYNSLALEAGGISDASGFSEGEVVVENGELTGLLKENAHMYMGRFVKFAPEELREGIRIADHETLRQGITSVCDAGNDGTDAWKTMKEMAESREIKTRIRCMIFDLAGKDENCRKYIQTSISLLSCLAFH